MRKVVTAAIVLGALWAIGLGLRLHLRRSRKQRVVSIWSALHNARRTPPPPSHPAIHYSPSGLGAPVHADVGLALDTEPVLGWRCWRVEILEGGQYELRSLTQDVLWKPRRAMRAHCRAAWSGRPYPRASFGRRPHNAPDRYSSCGIYLVKLQEDLDAWRLVGRSPYMQRNPEEPVKCVIVTGKAKLWGHVVPHQRGWRGEYAYPAEFHVPAPHIEVAQWLVDAFGVPAHVVDS